MTMNRNNILLGAIMAIALLAATVVALWQLGDAGASEPDRAEGTLKVGEQLKLKDGTTLTFVGLVSDSRCPADAMCIEMGEAVVEFAIAPQGGDAESFEMTFEGETVTLSIGDHDVELAAVWPYPLASQPADAGDYTVEVSIEGA